MACSFGLIHPMGPLCFWGLMHSFSFNSPTTWWHRELFLCITRTLELRGLRAFSASQMNWTSLVGGGEEGIQLSVLMLASILCIFSSAGMPVLSRVAPIPQTHCASREADSQTQFQAWTCLVKVNPQLTPSPVICSEINLCLFPPLKCKLYENVDVHLSCWTWNSAWHIALNKHLMNSFLHSSSASFKWMPVTCRGLFWVLGMQKYTRLKKSSKEDRCV